MVKRQQEDGEADDDDFRKDIRRAMERHVTNMEANAADANLTTNVEGQTVTR